MMHNPFLPVRRFALACVLFGLAVSLQAADSAVAGPSAPEGFTAVAVLVPGNDSGVSGKVTFTQTAAGVRVQAAVAGLTPGRHGFHVHQKGDLSKADLTSTGGHYNPAGNAHAGPMDAMRHMGDLGNLLADAHGNASADFVDQTLALAGPHSIIGRGVIVHAGEDDLKSQPTGAAGGRVAGGVIGIASD